MDDEGSEDGYWRIDRVEKLVGEIGTIMMRCLIVVRRRVKRYTLVNIGRWDIGYGVNL